MFDSIVNNSVSFFDRAVVACNDAVTVVTDKAVELYSDVKDAVSVAVEAGEVVAAEAQAQAVKAYNVAKAWVIKAIRNIQEDAKLITCLVVGVSSLAWSGVCGWFNKPVQADPVVEYVMNRKARRAAAKAKK